MVDFRLATAEDAPAIGSLHVRSWRETYTDLLPQAILSDLSVDNRTAMWATILEAPLSPNGTRVHLAKSAGETVGFGACGGQRDDAMRELGFVGEFGAIYVLRSHQGAGAGRALMSLMARDLAARTMASASLWVLRENRAARGFYERLGGTAIAERDVAEGEMILREVAYGWPDLGRLI